MSEWGFRPAEPADAEAFSRWTAENTQIDDADKLAVLKKNNPTVVWFVATKDGVPISFAPLYLQAVVGHMGFNPDVEGKDKLRAMEMLIDGVSGFMVQNGIREIVTLSRVEYPIAQWALKHDFELDTRQVFKLDLNKLMAMAQGK